MNNRWQGQKKEDAIFKDSCPRVQVQSKSSRVQVQCQELNKFGKAHRMVTGDIHFLLPLEKPSILHAPCHPLHNFKGNALLRGQKSAIITPSNFGNSGCPRGRIDRGDTAAIVLGESTEKKGSYHFIILSISFSMYVCYASTCFVWSTVSHPRFCAQTFLLSPPAGPTHMPATKSTTNVDGKDFRPERGLKGVISTFRSSFPNAPMKFNNKMISLPPRTPPLKPSKVGQR